jgi:pimeloyl-ACP methyl ester carboxylesterase
MTPEELRAVGKLGARVLSGTVSHIEQVHLAIASRAFRSTGNAGAPVRQKHDAITTAVYGGVRTAGRSAGLAVTGVASLLTAARPSGPLGTSPATSLAAAVLNAAVGDKLAAQHDPLAIRMAVRVEGQDVLPRRDEIEASFPAATSSLAVFLHGLGETDTSWRLYSGEAGGTYGSRLSDELGYTPLYLRYNTGRHISTNGRDVAHLLADVVSRWPRPVEEIIVIGHSMGGLVARSACHYGAVAGEPWVPRVRHVFYLGCPHVGAPLERGVSYLGWALARVPETQAYASLVNVRSAGIKDLRFGYILDEDWAGCDADRCLQNHQHFVPLLATANHYAISAAVVGDARHPVARLVGDLLVQPGSARGRRLIDVPLHNIRHYGGLHHLSLLNHPDVYKAMQDWLRPSVTA